jgi:RNA polymerase sigma-70 factor (ECF subfamily)
MSSSKNKTLSEWVEKYTDKMYSWTFHKVSNAELAADLVQDTFLAAAEKIESFKGNSSPKTWLFSILNNKIIDYYRKKINNTVPHENETIARFFETNGDWQDNSKPRNWNLNNDENLLDNHEFQLILNDCLDALPEKMEFMRKTEIS